ncbi:ACP S-malonyltransferase [Pseudoclavibacter chungangensis]|uniref:[acyl-carrier-protein] S-malonyltransferase n=1 Tax=Pseudoclavibacter chungangensis TaxID=587635 RepID=A0A7J5BNU4_9MICO|nr:ACP S-malonyltransferase [Pseudoclavibacter chungangensis]KAB1653438.1 ACP S-malonyltransferase [Pseudoclavibacter chungangensis]NYJ66374.1 [acyl-carrier-protein] S-malonyltransferase [Pseudoclavibacter chungangensis]
MIVISCPGQGSQTPGFLSPWIEDEANRTLLGELGEAAGVDLVLHGTVSDADTIRDTAVAQPLIVAAGILAWNALVDSPERAALVGGVAGHSVGEITAAYTAGIFDARTAGAFVGLRSRLMAEDAAKIVTSMSAVVGGVEADVLAALEENDLSPANFNGGGQIVAAGTPENLERLRENAPRGTRVIPLQVAGAFHTAYMADARDALAARRAEFTTADPVRTIWSNHAGEPVERGDEFVDLMVQQVARPVRWDACMASFADAGITGLIELTPAGTLVGLAKRGLKGTPAVAVKTPDDLDVAAQLLAGH